MDPPLAAEETEGIDSPCLRGGDNRLGIGLGCGISNSPFFHAKWRKIHSSLRSKRGANSFSIQKEFFPDSS
ncbi:MULTISPECIES: hypothetical protein [Arenibacter]|uniref:hypothetical protein n=1 Tax=Arenibacter TaxID=178469 RepID=UPI0012FFDD48|nr:MULTISPECIES: hypothetical protein [Arenibacter]